MYMKRNPKRERSGKKNMPYQIFKSQFQVEIGVSLLIHWNFTIFFTFYYSLQYFFFFFYYCRRFEGEWKGRRGRTRKGLTVLIFSIFWRFYFQYLAVLIGVSAWTLFSFHSNKWLQINLCLVGKPIFQQIIFCKCSFVFGC